MFPDKNAGVTSWRIPHPGGGDSANIIWGKNMKMRRERGKMQDKKKKGEKGERKRENKK
jgi:hypothetical protein